MLLSYQPIVLQKRVKIFLDVIRYFKVTVNQKIRLKVREVLSLNKNKFWPAFFVIKLACEKGKIC